MTEKRRPDRWIEVEETPSVLAELRGASDRVIGVVGAAILDANLSEALANALHQDEAVQRSFFRDATFEHKAQLGYLVGLFGKNAYGDFGRIGSVRNKFAHRKAVATFEQQSIRDACMALWCPDNLTRPAVLASDAMEHGQGIVWTGYRMPAFRNVGFVYTGRRDDAGNWTSEHCLFEHDLEQRRKEPRWRFETTIQLLCAGLANGTMSEPYKPRFG